MTTYNIIRIPGEARDDTEQLGSKPKFWVRLGDRRWLFKVARSATGEDWAEKTAAELAKALHTPAADVELAEFEGQRGCISLNFIDVDAGEALVHGNELLAGHVTDYDLKKTFRQSDHTLENIRLAIERVLPIGQAKAALKQLASYMVLDALIGNTDRHHENWGLKVQVKMDTTSAKISVAPSFDHASSLGRELQDSRRAAFLEADQVIRYVNRGRGGIFRDPAAPHGENPLRLVQLAARAYPDHFQDALQMVAALSPATVTQIISSLPEDRASPVAKRFAETMVLHARRVLIETLR